MKRRIFLFVICAVFLGTIFSFYPITRTGTVSKEIMKVVASENLTTFPMEQAYSYEEMLEDQYANGLITREKVQEKRNAYLSLVQNQRENSDECVRYGKITMDAYEFSKGFAQYKLTPVIYVGLYYSNPETPDHIESIHDPYIDITGGAACKFHGNIFYQLESGNSIYYGVNGDVYKTTTITGSNHFLKNVSFDGRVYYPTLNP